MIPNHYMNNGCFTKHSVKNGCLEFQGCLFPVRLGCLVVSGSRRMDPVCRSWGGFFEGFQIWQTRSRKSEILSLKHQEKVMLVPPCSVDPTVNCFFHLLEKSSNISCKTADVPLAKFSIHSQGKNLSTKDQVVSKKAIKIEAPLNYIPNLWP